MFIRNAESSDVFLASLTFPTGSTIRRIAKQGCLAKARPLHGCFIAPVRHWNCAVRRIRKLVRAKAPFPYLGAFQIRS
jgi:hypothetical protein